MLYSMTIPIAALCAISTSALAHPFNTSDFSLRTALEVTDQDVHAVIIAEVPTGVVLRDVAKGLGINEGFTREKINSMLADYNVRLWAYLASSTTITLNGKSVNADWKPVDNAANGKAAEEFFVYMVETHLSAKNTAWTSPLTVEVSSTAFANVPLYYTADHKAEPPWSKLKDDLDTYESTSQAGDIPFAGANPRKWTRDERMRSYTVVFARK
jgi:outer membrane lipopolysaccharide assembly protein LptE/RlpB